MANDDLDLDALENEIENEFNSDFGLDEITDEGDSKKRKPISDIGKGIKRVIVSDAIPKGVLSNVNNVISAEFSSLNKALYTGQSVVEKTRSIKDDIVKEFSPLAEELKELGRKSLPFTKKILPKKLVKKLDEKLQKEESHTTKYERSEEEIIKSKVQDVFKDSDLEKEKLREDVSNKLISEGYKRSIDKRKITESLLIRKTLEDQQKFFRIYSKNYYIKSLELKFKQIILIENILNIFKKHVVNTDDKLKAIVKNTALPDIIKQTKKEMAIHRLKDKMLGKIFGNEAINTFLSNLASNIKDSVVSSIDMPGMVIGQLSMMLDMMEMQKEMGEEDESSSMSSSLAGFGVATATKALTKNKIRNLILKNKSISNILKGLETKYKLFESNTEGIIRGTLKNLREFSDKAQEKTIFGEETSFSEKIANAIGEPIANILESSIPSRYSSGLEDKDPTSPVSWDALSRKTLISVIPSYLSKIVSYVKSISTGTPYEEMAYSPVEQEVVSKKKIEEEIKKKIKPSSLDYSLEKLTNTIVENFLRNGGDKRILAESADDLTTFVLNYSELPYNVDIKSIIDEINGKRTSENDIIIKSIFRGISDIGNLGKILERAYFREEGKRSDTFRVEFFDRLSDLHKHRIDLKDEIFKYVIEEGVSLPKLMKKDEDNKLVFDEAQITEYLKDISDFRNTLIDMDNVLLEDIDEIDLSDEFKKLKETLKEKKKSLTKENIRGYLTKEKLGEKLGLDKYKEKLGLGKYKEKLHSINEKLFSKPEVKDVPHVSGPGVYFQGSKAEAHIPLDKPKKSILETISDLSNLVKENISSSASSDDVKSIKENIANHFKTFTDRLKKTRGNIVTRDKDKQPKLYEKILEKTLPKNELTEKLENITSSIKNINPNVLGDTTEHLEKINELISKLEDSKVFGILNKDKRLTNLKETLSNYKASEKLENITSSIKNINPNVLGDTTEHLEKINELISKLEDSKVFGILNKDKRLTNLKETLSNYKASEKLENITSSIKSIRPDVSKLVGKENEVISKPSLIGHIISGLLSAGSMLGSGYLKYIKFLLRTIGSSKHITLSTVNSLTKNFFSLFKKAEDEEDEKTSSWFDKTITGRAYKRMKKAGVFDKTKEMAKNIGSKALSFGKKSALGILEKVGLGGIGGALGSAIGTGIGMTVGGIGSAVGALGTAGAFLASNPIGWAILGTAGLGLVSYGIYKHYARSDSDKVLMKARMKSYGVDDSLYYTVEKLENITLENFENNKSITVDNINYFVSKFGFDSDDKGQISYWLEWYKKRFIPCFRFFVDLFKSVFRKNFNEQDSIPKNLASKFADVYLRRVKKITNNVYNLIPKRSKYRYFSSINEKELSSMSKETKKNIKEIEKRTKILKGEELVNSVEEMPETIQELGLVDFSREKSSMFSGISKFLSFFSFADTSYGYMRLFNNLPPEQRSLISMRILAYGIKTKKHLDVVMRIENRILEKKENGEHITDDDVKKWANLFGFNPNDDKQVSYFVYWLKNRMYPIFLSYKRVVEAFGYDVNTYDIPSNTISKIYHNFKILTKNVLIRYGNIYPTVIGFKTHSEKRETQVKRESQAVRKPIKKSIPKPTTSPQLATKSHRVETEYAPEESRTRAVITNITPPTNIEKTKKAPETLTGVGRLLKESNRFTTNYTYSNENISKPVPSGETLDTLSARFESGRKGSLAIGWDSTGGTSYGRYQIAAKTGTFHEFLKFLENSNDPVANEVAKRLESAGNPDGGRHGPVANEWKRLAKENKIQKYEYEFIKKTHYDRSFNKLPDDLKNIVASNASLQKVLWSTSVQHGPSGASRIFSKAYEKSGNDPEKLIETIYQERSTKFGRSSPSVRRAVMNRFHEEEKLALNDLKYTTSEKLPTVESISKTETSLPKSESVIDIKPKPTIPIQLAGYTSSSPFKSYSAQNTQEAIFKNTIPESISRETITSPGKSSDELIGINNSQLKTLQDIYTVLQNINSTLSNNESPQISKDDISSLSSSIQTLSSKMSSLRAGDMSSEGITKVSTRNSKEYGEVNSKLLNTQKENFSI